MPGADVGPAARHRHHGGARGLFHHRIVDRDRLCRCERVLVELDESEIASGLRHGIGDRLHALRIDLAVFIRQHRGAEHEVAAVPEIARLDVVGRGRRIRLLDELRDRADLAGNDLAGTDVAVFGGGTFGLHAERHDVPGFRSRQPLAAGGEERRRVANHVIGGKRQHDRILVARLRKGRAGRDRRAGIAPHRLEQHVGLEADLRQLLQHHETIGVVGDDDRPLEQRSIRHPQQRVLERRTRSEQRQELLGMDLARGRPQPRSGAAAHDQGNNSSGHRRLKSCSSRDTRPQNREVRPRSRSAAGSRCRASVRRRRRRFRSRLPAASATSP